MTAPGPHVFGRGVVIGLEAPVPALWAAAEVVEVHSEIDGDAASWLHDAWLRRRPVVVRLHVDPTRFRAPQEMYLEPWKIDPGLDLVSDRLHFLVWANNYDARAGAPVWWWARKSERLGATATADGPADVLIGGRPAWIDGGPRGPLPDLGADALPVVHRETIDLGLLSFVAPATPARPSIELAPDQLAAVEHAIGPARIIAPAGSGKTRVLTERLRHLLSERAYESSTLLTVAYNKRAQEELVARTSALSPKVVTLNALGWELLGRPRVIEERDVRRVIESLVPTGRRRVNTDPIGPYLEALSRIRLGLVDPGVVEAERDDVPGIADAFDPYRQALKDQGVVDFDEQIYGAIERLLHNGEMRRSVQARYRHLLVDEFQDLTPAHVLLVRLLATPELDVFGVGDDDQVIYGHAGADPDFLVRFEEYFPGAASHPLTVNYRCPERIVSSARNLLGYNDFRVAKTIEASTTADPSVRALTLTPHSTDAGASTLVDTVRAAITDGTPPQEMAVLARVNSMLLAPTVALASAGVPMATGADSRVLDRTGARAALAYLRIATADGSFASADVIEVLRRPSRGLPQWIDKWFRTPTLRVRDIRQIADRLDDEKVSAKINSLAGDLEFLISASHRSTTRALLGVVKDRIGLGQAMGVLDANASASHLDDLEALEQVADLHPDPVGFEPWLRSLLAMPRDPDGVVLATVHRVKGQEWPLVVLYGVNDGLVPHRLSEDIEEERRVLHVGITRAIRRCVVLSDRSRPSPFLAELDGSAARSRTMHRPSPTTYETATRRPGSKARTPKAAAPTATTPSHEAVVGLAVTLNGGFAGTVHSTDATGALVVLATGAKMRVPYGETVTVNGVRAELRPEIDAALVEALRAWRTARAKSDGVPPYVVLHDRHLDAIASARPQDLHDLARVEGMGPRRLELYADEILAITGS